jgi:hypothetical protein
MSITICTPELFAKDIATHRLQTLRDDGLYRHLRVSKPDSGDQHYYIVTWPGYLSITGDMGAYVFQRLDDMFEFFRAPIDRRGYINPGYWAQKLEAIDARGALRTFNEHGFREHIKKTLDDFLLHADWPIETIDELREQVGAQVLDVSHDESRAVIAALDFRFSERGEEQYNFNFDFENDNFYKEYSFHYIWCCHAIVHAIALYDVDSGEIARKAMGA